MMFFVRIINLLSITFNRFLKKFQFSTKNSADCVPFPFSIVTKKDSIESILVGMMKKIIKLTLQ